MTACAIIRQVAAAAPPPTAAEVRCVNGERSHMAQMDGCRWLVVSMPLNVVVTAPTTTVLVAGIQIVSGYTPVHYTLWVWPERWVVPDGHNTNR